MTPEERAEKLEAALLGGRLSRNEFKRLLSAAIREAVAEEREACAVILDAAADRQKAAWDKLIAAGAEGRFTSYEAVYRGFADAIRARTTPADSPPGHPLPVVPAS